MIRRRGAAQVGQSERGTALAVGVKSVRDNGHVIAALHIQVKDGAALLPAHPDRWLPEEQ